MTHSKNMMHNTPLPCRGNVLLYEADSRHPKVAGIQIACWESLSTILAGL